MDTLYSAVKDGDLESLVICLMENEVVVNSFNSENRKTALHIAVENGHPNIVEVLLWNGADSSILNGFGLDCLNTALLSNNPDCISVIMKHEIYNKSLYQCCYDIILKGCRNWFKEFIKYQNNNMVSEWDVFKTVEQAYDALIIENIALNNEIKAEVEIYLLDYNYKPTKCSENIQEYYDQIKLDLLKICDELKPSLKTELFILKLKMFLKYSILLQPLHSRLKYSKTNLCWTQTEFLIALFICIQEKRQQFNFIYMNLDKKVIISYIQLLLHGLKKSEEIIILNNNKKLKHNKKKSPKSNPTEISFSKEERINRKLIPAKERFIANKLKQAENKIDAKSKRLNKIRKELIKNYNHLKNITTIEQIINKIQTALDIDLTVDGVIGIYTIRRVLQIIGEGVKSTANSPNISKAIASTVNILAPKYLIDITTNLRNILSHGILFRNSNEINPNELKNYQKLQEDLKKIINVLIDLLFNERVYAVKIFFNKILKCRTFKQMNQIKKYFPIEENIFFEKYYSQMDEFKEKWKNFCSEFHCLTEEEAFCIKVVNSCVEKINKPIGQEIFNKYFSCFIQIITKFRDNGRVTKGHCLSVLKHLLPNIVDNNFSSSKNVMKEQIYCIIERLLDHDRIIGTKLEEYLQDIKVHIFEDLEKPLTRINDFKFDLKYIPSFEIEYEVANILSAVLKEIENNTNIENEIDRHKNIFNGKNQMIKFIMRNEISQENCNILENIANSAGIEFKNIKINYMKCDKFKVTKNIENITSIYGKLLKDMKSSLEEPLNKKLQLYALEKFFNSNEFNINLKDNKKWIEFILEKHQNRFEEKVIGYLQKLINDLKKLIPLNLLTDEKLLIEELTKYKENRTLQSAIEMILFEIFQIIFEDDDKTDDDNSSMLTGRHLRNYLAHGNLIFDVFTIDPTRIIFISAIKIISMEQNSFLDIASFKTKAKMIVKNIYELRSLWIRNRDKYYDEDQKNIFNEEFENPIFTRFREFFNDYILSYGDTTNKNKDDIVLHYEHLFSAIFLNNSTIVKIICKKGLNVNVIHPDFEVTPLYLAVDHGHTKIINELLKYGATPQVQDITTSILFGLENRFDTLVEYFIDNIGNSPNIPYHNIIFAAIREAPIKIIKKLISLKYVNINLATDGFTPLHLACKLGRRSVVKLLISENANIDAETLKVGSPLFFAVLNGHIKIAKMLLKKGPKLNRLLNVAARIGNLDMVKLLLKHGADINEVNQANFNILHMAITHEFSDIAIYLIENKLFDLNVRFKNGYTYLHYAAERTTTKVAEALIKENVIDIDALNIFGSSPLSVAVKFSNAAMVKCFVSNGSDISILKNLYYSSDNNNFENVIALMECGGLNEINSNSRTSLHFAVHWRNNYFVKLLINHGENMEVFSDVGLTPLMSAVLNECYDIVLTFLHAGAHINTKTIYGWMNSSTKVTAIENDRINLIKLLIEEGAVIDSCWNVELTTAIVKDVSQSFIIIQIFIASEKELLTPLHIAINNDDVSVVKSVASRKEFISCFNNERIVTPIIMSIILNKIEYLKILIDCGADVNCSYNHQTPLMFAIELKNIEMVKILVKSGANVNAKTINNRTALFYAAQLEQTEIVKLLIDNGAKIDKILCMSLILINLKTIDKLFRQTMECDE